VIKGSEINFHQRTLGEYSLSGYGPMNFMNCPVRILMVG